MKSITRWRWFIYLFTAPTNNLSTMSHSKLTYLGWHLRLWLVIIRPRVTTNLVPLLQTRKLESTFWICECGAHGHFILANGLELEEHCSKDTALQENSRLAQSILFGRNWNGEGMSKLILDAHNLRTRRGIVHPDIVRSTDEWNMIRAQGGSPYPATPHAFIVGGGGFGARVFIAKTVPLSREPFGGYELIEESGLPNSVDSLTSQDP